MKKSFIFISIICLAIIMSFSANYVNATELNEQVTTSNESEDTDSTNNQSSTDDEIVYMNDYSDYENLINGMNYTADYKKFYEEKVKNEVEDYKKAQRAPVYEALILEASEPKVTYGEYGQYGYYYKTTYQTLKIKLLNGPHKGEVIDDYSFILTADIYENIKLSEVHVGEKINVVVDEDENGEIYASASSYDSPYVRSQYVLILFIIVMIFFIIYAGKHALKASIMWFVLADLLLVVMAPLLILGYNPALLVIMVTLLSGLGIACLSLKRINKALVAVFGAVFITFFVGLIIYGFSLFAKLSGISYEATYLMEYILPTITESGNIVPTLDFYTFNFGITLLIVFIVSLFTSIKTVEIFYNYKLHDSKFEIPEVIKSYIAEKSLFVSAILMILMVPKYLLLLCNKYSFVEIINSEMVIIEVSRMLFAVLAISLTAPISILLCKFASDDDIKQIEN